MSLSNPIFRMLINGVCKMLNIFMMSKLKFGFLILWWHFHFKWTCLYWWMVQHSTHTCLPFFTINAHKNTWYACTVYTTLMILPPFPFSYRAYRPPHLFPRCCPQHYCYWSTVELATLEPSKWHHKGLQTVCPATRETREDDQHCRQWHYWVYRLRIGTRDCIHCQCSGIYGWWWT